MKEPFRFTDQPVFENTTFIIGWDKDSGKIAQKVLGFLNEKLSCQKFCQINPEEFFSFAGVSVDDDIIQFPESSLFHAQRRDLVIFLSDQPNYQHNKFLNTVLDLAGYYCKAREIYTISGMVSLSAHSAPRKIYAVFNESEFRERLHGRGLEEMTWEGQPAISSYLLWIARRRGISGVSLWPEVPFYLASSEDPAAIKKTLSFLDERFGLNLNLEIFDVEIQEQNEKIEWLRKGDAEIDQYLSFVESGLLLDEESQLKLAKEIYEILKK